VLPIPVELFVALMFVGSALLAGWTLTRFHRLGPRTLAGALATSAAAMILVSGLPSFIDGVLGSGIPSARLIVVFGLAVPTYTYFFVAAGWFMRVLRSMLGGLR